MMKDMAKNMISFCQVFQQPKTTNYSEEKLMNKIEHLSNINEVKDREIQLL